MTIVTVHYAKTNLSKLIAAVESGEEVIIARAGKPAVKLVMVDEGRKEFQNILFSKIVPNCKKLGLLDRNDGWLRKKFGEINVIQFEDWRDTGEEYELLDRLEGDADAVAAEALTKMHSA